MALNQIPYYTTYSLLFKERRRPEDIAQLVYDELTTA